VCYRTYEKPGQKWANPPSSDTFEGVKGPQQGVLQAFRRRLDIKDAILFAGILPVGLRALFVADWDTAEPRRPFEDRAVMTKEVQALRAEHNFAPETAIRDVARALRRHVDEVAFERILAGLPEGAAEFWKP
jgi:uncharacterized protein (DUF2267 family)